MIMHYRQSISYGFMRRANSSSPVEQWSRNPVTRVRNLVDALVPFGKVH